MALSLPLARRATKCLVPGASALYLFNEGSGQILRDYANRSRNLLLPNQANGGSDGTTTGFTAMGSTLTSDTSAYWQGSRSLKVVTAGTVANEGVKAIPPYYTTSGTYTVSAYVKGAGVLKAAIYAYTGAGLFVSVVAASLAVTADGTWRRLVGTGVVPAGTEYLVPMVFTNVTQAVTFYVDGLQLEEGSVATEWQAPPNHGILGSSTGADTNDPTWVREGLSYDANDYVKFGPISDGTGTVQPMGAMATAFYVPSPVSAASAKSCSFALAPNAAIYLGAVAGAPANNIVTVQYAAGSYTSWCDAAATITAGWHTLAVAWNGTTYDLYLDGAMLPTTTAGTPALLSPTAAFCCYDGTTYGPGIVRAARGIWARSLGAGELARARAYLKGYLAKFGVVLP